ncbi:serpin-ZX-like [Pyrus x bretschneideri]|uniref:serpin-ZX-like n=1 Tax=Pyrus x bretschneideri TaxID=225117 RepID=UPI00202E9C07|nr:serpin-ZX-like [Pyrus x bretschneideri]
MKLSSFFNIRPLAPSLFPFILNSRIQTLSTITVPETMKIEKSIRTQTDVGLRMMKPLFLNEGKKSNIVYSPLSIHVVLSLIAVGTNDQTEEELLFFLKSQSTAHLNLLASKMVPLVFADGSPSDRTILSFANRHWVDKSTPLKPFFKKVVYRFYKAAQKEVDFQTKAKQARIELNSWAEKKTKDINKEILPFQSVDNLTRLIFANALYFKGVWDDKFDASETKEYDFNRINGKSSVKVPFMTNYKNQYLEAFDCFKVLKLNYEKGENEEWHFSMCVFLPDEKDGLPTLVDRVCSELGFLNRHLPRQKVKMGDFRIPKFNIAFGFEASTILKDLGPVLSFHVDLYKGGNLIEMVNSPLGETPSIFGVLHKSFIEVNEEGTEAAVVTAIEIIVEALHPYHPPKMIDFVANHLFLFFLREETNGAVLFIGQVLNLLEG